MKPAHRNFLDLHPKLLINTQILWIVVGTGLLYKWLPRTVDSWQAGETYNLPQGITFIVIGVVIVVANFILVNSAVGRLQSKIPSDPTPNEAESC
jgi:TRAP-type mannitol/chloroaromatic compound transport system permease small subunit